MTLGRRTNFSLQPRRSRAIGVTGTTGRITLRNNNVGTRDRRRRVRDKMRRLSTNNNISCQQHLDRTTARLLHVTGPYTSHTHVQVGHICPVTTTLFLHRHLWKASIVQIRKVLLGSICTTHRGISNGLHANSSNSNQARSGANSVQRPNCLFQQNVRQGTGHVDRLS